MTYRFHRNLDSGLALSERGLRGPANIAPVPKQQSYHVMTRIGGGWSMWKEDAGRASANFESKKDAVKHAREVARAAGGELCIYKRDGTVQELTTYSSRGASGRAKRR
jgi:hypothetical protein